MKHVAYAKPEELETTMDEEMDEEYLEEEESMELEETGGVENNSTFSLVDENVSHAYDENSPAVANVMPVVEGKGTKRKPVSQELVEDNGRQARKKQKSPTQKQPQSIFDSDSEPSTSAQAPALKANNKVTKKAAKGRKAPTPESDREELKNDGEDHAKPMAKTKGTKKAPKGRKVNKPQSDREESENDGEDQANPAPIPKANTKVNKKAAKGRKVAIKPQSDREESENDEEDQANPAPIPVENTKATKKVAKGRKVAKPQSNHQETDNEVDPSHPVDPSHAAKKAPSKSKGKAAPKVKGPGNRGLRPRNGGAKEETQAPIKIKVPMPPKALPNRMPLAKMLAQTMETLKDSRKGVSFIEVKHHLAVTFQYTNLIAIQKAVKARLNSGEYVKVTGVGLNGSIKLAPKTKPKARKDDSTNSATASGSSKKPRKNSKPLNSMTEAKQNKRRKSLSVKAVKAPKRTKNEKSSGKAVAKKTSGKLKATRSQ